MKKIQHIFRTTVLCILILIPINSYAVNDKLTGTVYSIKTLSNDITVGNTSYKLSTTVKVYGFSGNKYLNSKKLRAGMSINYKYSKLRGVKTISEIWVIPD